MSQLQPFTVPASINPDGVKVRTHGDRRNPLFCLADVCQVLDIANVGNVAARLDDDEKGVRLADTPGGRQEMVFVNESGFYTVILRSDKPQAQPFRRWVTREVLPSIREYGCYPPPAGGTRAGSLDEALEAAIADIEQNGYEVVGEARGWGDNTAIVKDSYGGYNLARIEG